MKRILGIVLAMLLMAVSFAACRPNIIEPGETDDYEVNLNVDPEIEETIRILVPSNDGGLEKGYIDALIPGFREKFPNVTVEFDMRTVSDEKYVESIVNAVASTNVPDLFYTNTVFYYYLVSKKAVVSLEPYYEASEQAGVFDMEGDFYASFFDMSSYQNKRYIVPRSADSVVCYYNTEILEAAGIDPKTDPRMTNGWTWDDLVSVCRELNAFFKSEEGKKSYGDCYALMPLIEWEAIFNALMESYGSSAFDASGNVAFDSEETKAMAEMLRGLTEEGRILAPYGVSSTFANGKCAFAFSSGGPAQMDIYATVSGKFDVLPFPLVGDQPKVGCGFAGWGISSSSTAVKRDLAWQFLNYMISEEGQMALINAGMTVSPIRVGLAEEKKWAKGYESLNLDAFLVNDQYKVSSKFFTTQDPSCTFDILTSLQEFMKGLTSSTKTVDRLIEIAVDDLTEAIRA